MTADLAGILDAARADPGRAHARLRDLAQRIEADPDRGGAFIGAIAAAPADATAMPEGPLSGAAFSVKDNIDAAGMVTTCGSRVLEGAAPAAADSDIVALLKARGAHLVGKNTMHEFALGATGENRRFGNMPNPWDPRRHVGGSSGGSAIAVARGHADISVGTDSGGSVRMPAAFTGIAGFKPTPGILSMQGVAGASWSIDCLGLMTRSVADLCLVWDALVDADPAPGSASPPRIAYLQDFSMGRVADPVWESYLRAVETLRAQGFDLTGISVPGLESCPQICISIVYPEVASSHYELMRAAPERYEQEVRALIAMGEAWSARHYLDAQRARQGMRARLEAAIAGYDLLMTPTVAVQPPLFGEVPSIPGDAPGSTLFTLMRFTVPFNVTACPAISVPAGLDGDGLPVGLQLVGRPGADAAILAAAAAAERCLGRLTLPSDPG